MTRFDLILIVPFLFLLGLMYSGWVMYYKPNVSFRERQSAVESALLSFMFMMASLIIYAIYYSFRITP